VQSRPDLGPQFVVTDPIDPIYDLGPLGCPPPGHERTRQDGIGEIDGQRIVYDATRSRWVEVYPFGTAVGVQPCDDLIEPTTQPFRRDRGPRSSCRLMPYLPFRF
jgi:hypothetical protein